MHFQPISDLFRSSCTSSWELSWSALLYPCTLTHSFCDKDNCCCPLNPSTTTKTQNALHFLFSTASESSPIHLNSRSFFGHPLLAFFCKRTDLSLLWKGHIGRCFIFTLEAIILQRWSSFWWWVVWVNRESALPPPRSSSARCNEHVLWIFKDVQLSLDR